MYLYCLAMKYVYSTNLEDTIHITTVKFPSDSGPLNEIRVPKCLTVFQALHFYIRPRRHILVGELLIYSISRSPVNVKGA